MLPATRADVARRWLQTTCVPDRQYADASVWTIYYDTAGFLSLDEKLNSDYLKTKVRLRWYGTPEGIPQGSVFIEAKLRVGTRRDKVRVRLDVPAEHLAGKALTDPLLQTVPRLLLDHGIVLGPGWVPMLALRYRRSRFVDSASGTRINFDRDINAVAVNHRYLFACNTGPLPLALVETKGLVDGLPPRLHPLVRLGARKTTFSKYSALVMHLRRTIV